VIWSAYAALAKIDDNWVDGTQEYIYTFNSPYWASMLIAGYGFTETAIHEAGHHLALSHPHDGYGPVYNFAGLQLAWAGDHSYTVMNYHNNVLHFGVFNKDSMYRYMTIEYLNYANKILEMIDENPHAGDVAGMVASADALATAAVVDYQAMNYLSIHAIFGSPLPPSARANPTHSKQLPRTMSTK
jgi:hypothetical protein